MLPMTGRIRLSMIIIITQRLLISFVYQIEHEWNGIDPVGVNAGVRSTATNTNDDAKCTPTPTQTDVNANMRNEKPHFDFKAYEDTHASSSSISCKCFISQRDQS